MIEAKRGEPGMETSDLKIFATVARCNGMNRAAAALNTVQSNVTGTRARARAQDRLRALRSTQPGVA